MTAHQESMTMGDAMNILSGKADVMALVQEHWAHHKVRGKPGHHRTVQLHQQKGTHHLRQGINIGGNTNSTKGAEEALEMLNGMIEEAVGKLDAERVRCSEFELKMTSLMEDSQQSIAAFNSASAKARGEIMEANAQIETISYRISSIEEALAVLLKNCAAEDAEFEQQLSIIADDVEIMNELATKSACGGDDAATTLLQCKRDDGTSFLGFGHKVVREKVLKLKTEKLQEGFQQLLWEHAAISLKHATEVVHDVTPEEFAKTFVPHNFGPSFLQTHIHDDPAETEETTTTPRPLTPREQEKLNAKCARGNPNCEKVNDKFLVMQGEVLEAQTVMMEKRDKHKSECDAGEANFKAQLQTLQGRLKIEQTALAKATEAQNEADEASRLETINYQKLHSEWSTGMKECGKNIGDFEAEECSLTKLRTEVFDDKYVVDCEVGAWQAEPCDKACGGGTQELNRAVTAHPVGGGAECPALKMVRSCNEHDCPIDCQLGPWNGWSVCSAACGGGVRERGRDIEVDQAHGGEPCGETVASEQCNAQACNVDCVLAAWTEFGTCSQECDGGFKMRYREIAVAAVGQGTCPDEEDDTRAEFEECNEHACLAPEGPVYSCEAKLDVILLLDGSGSIGADGWAATQKAGASFARAMVGGDANVNLAVQLFSGPGTLGALYDCMGFTSNVPDMETDCNIKWIQHLSPETEEAATAIENMVWPARTTLTSAALALAEAELKFSRPDAESVVICVTDGIPMSYEATYYAAKSLRRKARLIFVPVTQSAPLSDIPYWASRPAKENVIEIQDFATLEEATVLDEIILKLCPSAS